MHKLTKFVAPFAILALAALPLVAGAQIFGSEPLPGQFEGSETFSELVVKILEILLAIVGLVAILFLVWGGFKYITAGGEEEKIKDAKKTIINSLIGVVVVIVAFALVRIVANAILGGTTGV